jgi:uncharacterized membrane protein YvbJ
LVVGAFLGFGIWWLELCEMAPSICPNCGATVPRNAKACPDCGSDEQTGWSDATETDGLDLPDENFDYDDFVKKEFGKGPVPHGTKWYWWIVAVIVVVAFMLFCLRWY